MTLTQFLTGIADAIRSKKGTTESINAMDFAEEILELITAAEPYLIETYDSNKRLVEVKMEGITEVRNFQFNGCSFLASANIPEGVTKIGNNAFNETALVTVDIPSTVTEMGSRAFGNMLAISTITIHADGENIAIAENAFVGIYTNLDIYIPWSEGEVEGAPWGATNATIHYDYTPS